MIKRLIGIVCILSLTIGMLSLNSVSAEENIISELGDSEYGYIFTVNSKPEVELMDCDIDIISDEAQIYHVDTLEQLYKAANILDIGIVAEDTKVELFEYPNNTNDTLYSTQWALNACNIPYFWENGITGDGIKVGVVDTGLNTEHEDLADLKVSDGVNICAMLDNNEEKINDITDENGHGTGVTGMFAATIDNGIGVAGIVDDVTVVPIKIYDSESNYSLSVGALLKGIEYAYMSGCKVINISVGFTNPSDYLIDITNNLVQTVMMNNVIIVAASGNQGTSTNRIEYPVACDNVIGVESVQKSGNTYVRSPFSTANNTVTVSAPGSSVTGLKYNDNSGYEYKNGTSFAAPIVTGLVAGLKQVYPDMTVAELNKILTESSVDLESDGYDINTGYGLVNFKSAYDKSLEIMGEEATKPQPTITPEPTTIPEPQKNVLTSIIYDEAKNKICCKITNTTDSYLPVTGIIACYNNNCLEYITTITGLYSGEQMIYINNEYDTVKFFVWEDLQHLKPYIDAENSIHTCSD